MFEMAYMPGTLRKAPPSGKEKAECVKRRSRVARAEKSIPRGWADAKPKKTLAKNSDAE